MTSKTINRSNTELTAAELDHVYGGGQAVGATISAVDAVAVVFNPFPNQGISNAIAALGNHFSLNVF